MPDAAFSAAMPLYTPLSTGDIRRILDNAYRILSERGVAVYSDEGRRALAGAGAAIGAGGAVVRLPRSMVEDAIASNPSRVTLYSRDGERDVELGGGRVYFGTGGTAIYVIDPETGLKRPSYIHDLVLNARLIQRLDNLDLTTINVFPNEIADRDAIDINRFFHTMDNMTRHVMGGIYSLNGCMKVVEMAEMIAGSPEALREKPFISFIILMISPLKIDGAYGDMVCRLAKEQIPVVIPTMPVCGLTSPITLASNVLMCIAETLAGITMIQSVRKGAPGIAGSVGTIMNLSTMQHVGGAVERAMIQSAVSQILQYLELPIYSTAGTTDAKETDVQAAWESAVSNLLVSMSGAHYIHDSAGLVESELTVSYDKLVVDDEIIGMCRRVMRGIEVSDESLAVDLILEKGPEDHFVSEFHTLMHMHDETFVPRLANRDLREKMAPGSDALARARGRVRQISQEEAESVIEPFLRQRILTAFPEIQSPDQNAPFHHDHGERAS